MAAVDRVLPWRRHQNVTADELTPLLSAYRRRHPKASVTMINRAYGFHSAEAALALIMLACGPVRLELPYHIGIRPHSCQ